MFAIVSTLQKNLIFLKIEDFCTGTTKKCTKTFRLREKKQEIKGIIFNNFLCSNLKILSIKLGVQILLFSQITRKIFKIIISINIERIVNIRNR